MVNGCIYSGLRNHKSEDCKKVLNVARRKEILTSRRLSYNYIIFRYSATYCQLRRCRMCNKKHHTFICQNGNATMVNLNTKQNPWEQCLKRVQPDSDCNNKRGKSEDNVGYVGWKFLYMYELVNKTEVETYTKGI